MEVISVRHGSAPGYRRKRLFLWFSDPWMRLRSIFFKNGHTSGCKIAQTFRRRVWASAELANYRAFP